MDEPTPPAGERRLPAVRPPGPVARPSVVPPGAHDPPPAPQPAAPSGPRDPHQWRRLTRTRRGAAGLALVAASLLLWPFAGWFWIPWLAGLVVVVLVALLRLDRLLHGWSWHLGALAVLVGLMLKTEPWDWALAASLGVLLAGLVQLPWWRLAAVGAVLCVVSGLWWGVQQYRVAKEVTEQQAQAQAQSYELNQMSRPTRALPVMLRAIARGDAGPVCSGLLSDAARASFVAAVGAPDCSAAVMALGARVEDPTAYGLGRAPSTTSGDLLTVDACHLTWTARDAPGPQLGVLEVGRVAGGTTYVVTAFRACAM